MFCNYVFRLFLWVTIPAAVYSFISTSTCRDVSSSTTIGRRSQGSNNHFIYRNGNLFHQYIDSVLVRKHASVPFVSTTSSVSFLVRSSSLHMKLYYYGRDIRKKKSPTSSSTGSSTRRDTSLSTTTTISATIPWSWTTKSSTTQLYARGGKKKRNVSSKTKKKEPSTYSIEEKDTYPSPYTASSKNNKQLNRKERMEILLSQHGQQCIWCNTPINISTATTDHIIPKIKGGPSWIENELASCYKCNKARGHIPALDYLDKMKEKGLFLKMQFSKSYKSWIWQLKNGVDSVKHGHICIASCVDWSV